MIVRVWFSDASNKGYVLITVDQHGTRCVGKNGVWSKTQLAWSTPKQELYALVQAQALCLKFGFKDVVYLVD